MHTLCLKGDGQRQYNSLVRISLYNTRMHFKCFYHGTKVAFSVSILILTVQFPRALTAGDRIDREGAF